MNNTGTIKKGRFVNNFTTVPNSIFKDKNLSLRAKGLLCFLLSLPADWVVHKTNLHKDQKEGRDAVSKAFDELVLGRYIFVETIRSSGQFAGYNYLVYPEPYDTLPGADIPITDSQETADPVTDNPKTDNPKSVIQELLNTNSTNETEDKLSSCKQEDQPPGNDFLKNEIPEGQTPPGSGAPPEEKRQKLYPRFIDVYFKWHISENKFKPLLDDIQGKKAKELITYFKDLAKDSLLNFDNISNPTEEQIEDRVIKQWEYVFANWKKVDPFYQDGITLKDIRTNIGKIINNIKNGIAKDKSRPKEQQRQVINQGDAQATRIMQNIIARRNSNGDTQFGSVGLDPNE